MFRLAIVVYVIFVFTGQALAQSVTSGKKHRTVEIKQKKKAKENSLLTDSCAIVFLPDSLIRDSLRYEFTKIKEYADRRKWTRQLYKMIFIYRHKTNIDIIEAENSENRFKAYQGRKIRDIQVTILPPFGTSIRDTCYLQDSLDWFRSMANTVHQRSSERLIKKQLTVRSGGEVSPFELVENELLLKQLSNIDDALINIIEIQGDTTRVDLLVVCKDEFSWTGKGSSNFTSSATIGIETKNLFRTGHQVSYEASFRKKRKQKWGNLVEYSIPNLFSTRFDFYGRYENTHANDLYSIQLERPFLTSHTKWAGGATFSRIYSSETLVDRDIVKPVELFNYRMFDLWTGRSFRLPFRFSFNQNIFITARYTATRFLERPEISSDSNHFYYNRNAFLGAFSYLKLKYFKANLIYDFGRTEDIPSGLFASFLFGAENTEFSKFAYLGAEGSYSWFSIHSDRFYSIYAALGSFLNGTNIESGVFRLNGSFISSLKQLSRHRFRYYCSFDYVRGIKRHPDDFVYFQDYNIYGFDSDTLRGCQKFSASISGTLFLPSIKYGFRTAVSGFLDMGVLGVEKKSLLKSRTYWGIGLSLNLRNDNVVFKNLSIRLTYYPKVPADMRAFDLHATGNRKRGFYDYKVHKPETIKYE